MKLDKKKFLEKLEILKRFEINYPKNISLIEFDPKKIIDKYPFFNFYNDMKHSILEIKIRYTYNDSDYGLPHTEKAKHFSIYKDNDDYYYVSIYFNLNKELVYLYYKLDQLTELMYFLKVIFGDSKLNEDIKKHIFPNRNLNFKLLLSKLNKYRVEEKFYYSKCIGFTQYHLKKLKKYNFEIWTTSGHKVLSINKKTFTVDIHLYEDDYFFVRLHNKENGEYTNYKLDQLNELNQFLQILLNNKLNESNFDYYKSSNALISKQTVLENLKKLDKYRNDYILNGKELILFDTDKVQSKYPLSKTVYKSDDCRYTSLDFTFDVKNYIIIKKDYDEYFYIFIRLNDDVFKYKLDQYRELDHFLNVLFNNRINEYYMYSEPLDYLYDTIYSIKTIKYNGGISTDNIKKDLEKIKSIKFDHMNYEDIGEDYITYSICFGFIRNNIVIQSYNNAEYMLELTIEKLQDDYYRVIFSFFKDYYKSFNLLEDYDIEVFFDQFGSLKKYLNKIKTIIYGN